MRVYARVKPFESEQLEPSIIQIQEGDLKDIKSVPILYLNKPQDSKTETINFHFDGIFGTAA